MTTTNRAELSELLADEFRSLEEAGYRVVISNHDVAELVSSNHVIQLLHLRETGLWKCSLFLHDDTAPALASENVTQLPEVGEVAKWLRKIAEAA